MGAMKKLFDKYRQVILYLFFGITTTAVNWLIYTPLQGLVGMTVANALAWLGAVVYAFVTNKLFVFESRFGGWKTWVGEGVKFFGARIISGLFEIFLPTALFTLGLNMPLLGIEGGMAKALVSVLIIVMNYVLSKFIVFNTSAKG